MEPKEIVAYLKGAINLGKINSLNENETNTFKTHLGKINKFEDSPEKQFCSWFLGYLDCLDSRDVPQDKFIKVMQKINEIENKNINNGYLGERLPGGAIAKC